MKKYIFSITFVWIAITCNFNAFGQCDNPSICDMNDLTFTPFYSAGMSLPTFNLNCDTTTIEADFNTPAVTGNINYTWYDSSGTPISNSSELAAPTPGNYRLEVDYMIGANQFCCAQEIIVNPWRAEDVSIVFRTLGQNSVEVTEICKGESVNVVAMPNTYCMPYMWTFPDGNTPVDDAGIFLPGEITTTGSNTVSLQVTDGVGGTQTVSAILMVNPLPNLTANATPPTICEGDEVTLSATPSISNYTYIWNTGQSETAFSDAPDESMIYQVTVTDTNGCQSTDEVNVQVSSSPDATIIGGNQSICAGDDIMLMTTENGAEYLWSNGDTGQSTATITPTEIGSYSVTVTEDGCSATDIVTITVIPLENITIMGEDEICEGESTILTAPLADTYMWSNGSDMQSITVSPATDEMYSVMVTSGECASSGEINVTVKPPPTATIMGDTEICEGENTTLTAAGGNSYLWSNNETTQAITVSPTNNQSYTVTVTAANDCTDTETRTVSVTSVNLSISGNTTICEGESTMLTASGGGTYLWSTTETTQSITVNPTETTTYTVTKTVNGCPLSGEVTVNVNPTYEMFISETICPGDSYTVGSNTYTQTGNYIDVLSTFKGCDSTVNLNLTVQPIVSHQFFADSLFSLCTAQTVTFDLPNPDYDYIWSSSDGQGVMQNGDCVAFELRDATTINLEVVNGDNCSINQSYLIDFMQLPDATAKILRLGTTSTIFCNRNDFVSYQWGREHRTDLCPETFLGEIYQNYLATDIDLDNYYYWVEVVDAAGCQSRLYYGDTPFMKIITDPAVDYGNLSVQVLPNPNHGIFVLQISGNEDRNLDLFLYDALGRELHRKNIEKLDFVEHIPLNVSALSDGVYFVRITGNQNTLLTEKIIVRH